MSTLFLYYSFTGNGDVVAERMRESGAEVYKVETVKPLARTFLGSMLKGGFLAAIGHKSRLKDFAPSLEGYDRIVIGSPVWNGRVSCPINAVLDSLDLTGKSVDFLLYAGGGVAPKAESRLKKEYPDAEVVTLKEPKKYSEELGKLREFFCE